MLANRPSEAAAVRRLTIRSEETMEAENVLNQLTFSENSPLKTMLLQQENFELVRITLGKGAKIPPHQGGHAVFFLVLQGKGVFTRGEEKVDLAQNQYLYIKTDETRGIQALEDLVIFAVKC
jgi:quercetin dioxygenase-like cupin family protein